MATSQNGFPALTQGAPQLHRWVVPGCEREFTLRYGAAGFLLTDFMRWFHKHIERLDTGTYDDWGWAYRPVRGATDLSNHASGTALDANATLHVLGARGTFSKVQTFRIRRRLKRYGGTIRWGGDYQGRADEMHFEIDKPLSTCEAVAKKRLGTRWGKATAAANPGQREVIYS